MPNYTKYSKNWRLKEVVPYLLKYHFGNNATSNNDLSQAFWSLVGKNVEFGKRKMWTDGKTGVPYQIHRLVKEGILTEKTQQQTVMDSEYPEYHYPYVLGIEGERFIRSFEDKYSKTLIDQEIEQYLNVESFNDELDFDNYGGKNILKKIIANLNDTKINGYCMIETIIGWRNFLEDGNLPFTPEELHKAIRSVIDRKGFRPKGEKLFELHKRCNYAYKNNIEPDRGEEALEKFIIVSNDVDFYNQIPIGGGAESIDIGIEDNNSKFTIVELKSWKGSDTPMKAIVQSLKYLIEYRVIIKRRIKKIKEYDEMNLVILAPETYWVKYSLIEPNRIIKNNKLFNVKQLLKDLSKEFRVRISFMALSLSYDHFLSSYKKFCERCDVSGRDEAEVLKEDKIISLERENWRNLASSDHMAFDSI